MTKYEEYFQKMLADNSEVFDTFREVHSRYAADNSLQEEFNEAGKPVIELIREYEDRLCGRSEGSGYAVYSGNLAEKFWERVRSEFPLVDRVGIIIRKQPVSEASDEVDFEIKKIETVEFELRRIKLVQ